MNQDKDLCKQLNMAIHTKQRDTVVEMLRQGVSPNCDNDGVTPLIYAGGIMGDLPMVRLLLDAGADPNLRGMCGTTALFSVVEDGYIEIAQELIARGAEINIQDEDGETPLMAAASRLQTEAVLYLLSQGADVHLLDAEGFSAVDWVGAWWEEPDAVDQSELTKLTEILQRASRS